MEREGRGGLEGAEGVWEGGGGGWREEGKRGLMGRKESVEGSGKNQRRVIGDRSSHLTILRV